VPTVPRPIMPTPTPASEVGHSSRHLSMGPAKSRQRTGSRSEKCYLSVESAVIATTFGPIHQIFNLRIDDDTMRRRLQERTNNEFGKQSEEVELMLKLNRRGKTGRSHRCRRYPACQPGGRRIASLSDLNKCSPSLGTRFAGRAGDPARGRRCVATLRGLRRGNINH
jgi:hypothetical protein